MLNMRRADIEAGLGTAAFWLGKAEEALQQSPRLTPHHTSSHALVFRLDPPALGLEYTHYLKVFPRRTLKDRFKEVFRGTHAQRVFRGNRLLRDLGFLVPRIKAMGALKSGVWAPASFLMESGLDGVPLPVYLEAYTLSHSHSLTVKRDLLKRLALLINRMHKRGVVHGDLHGGNLLICDRSQGQRAPRIALLDTLRTRYCRRRRTRWILEDLRQLNQVLPPVVSWSERLAFLQGYLPGSPLEGVEVRALIDKLVRMSEERLARKGRSLKERWDPGKKGKASRFDLTR